MQAETGYQKEKPKKQIQTAVLLATGCIGKTLDDFGGKTYAAAIPGAVFKVLPSTGHVPQMETPELVIKAIEADVGTG